MEWHESGERPSPTRKSEAQSVYKSEPVEQRPKKPKRKLSKLGVFVVIVLVLVVAGVGCSVLGSGSSASRKDLTWPTSGLATRLPQPDATKGEVSTNSDSSFDADVYGYNEDKYNTYLQKCKDAGFTVDADGNGSTSYSAYDKDGYKLELNFWKGNGSMDVDLDAPVPNDPISWPTTGLAAQIPAPKSLTGKVSTDSSTNFGAYVTNTSPDDYASYVSACISAGFSNDYNRYDELFHGSNANGTELYVDYVGFNTMNVRASQDSGSASSANAGDSDTDNAAKESGQGNGSSSADSANATAQQASDGGNASDGTAPASNDNAADNATADNAGNSSTGNANAASNSSSNGVVTPSFKATMDSYEAFFDKYVAFVKKYNDEGHPASMLADYADMMKQYTDTMAKFEAIDEKTLSDADLAYYIEVNARIQQKLLTISS